MSYALSAGVSGLQAFQQMLDVAGNNLANINTTAYKSSTVTFTEVLGQTLAGASQPSDQVGGTNPMQIGGGVAVSSIAVNTGQGSIIDSGNDLDMAIDGQGYFTVLDGAGASLYTRTGTFSVDADGYLVDTATGYRVQRLGTTGEAEAFQDSGDSGIKIPYETALPANKTTQVTMTGNLSADATGEAQAQVLVSNVSYTYEDGTDALVTTEIDQLDQFSGGSGTGGQLATGETGTITIAGYNPDGTAMAGTLTMNVDDTTTLQDLIDHLNDNVLSGSTASLADGQLTITDDETGYSLSDISLSYEGSGALETPAYFKMKTVGGEEVQHASITIYDSQGGEHVLSGAYVRTDDVNTWDFIVTSVTGEIDEIDMDSRRVMGITFDEQTGAYTGIADGETSVFQVAYKSDPDHPQLIDMNFGTAGSFNGLTQFAGSSTAVAREQDGYGAGNLASVAVSADGVIIGSFTNGVKKDLAMVEVALFNNPAGLQSVGGGYYVTSGNSGSAVSSQATTGGAGSIRGGALEKSNVDTAVEFVNLIEAQNGYQANARTITIANDILQELTNLIR